MQAGNFIDFIQPFFGQDGRDTTEPTEETAVVFQALMLRLCLQHAESLETVDFMDEDTGETESHFEIRLKIDAPKDGSYLYIVLYGSSSPSDPIKDICVNISEHAQDGAMQKSYTYKEYEGKVYRSDNENRDLMRDYHFSYIDFIETYDELLKSKDSEWSAERNLAKEAFDYLSNLNENADLEAAVGLNHLPVDLQEIINLGKLLKYGKPVKGE